MLNKITIIGRLGADPDVRYTQNNTAVANISVATSERYKDKSGQQQEKTQWHRVVVWDRLAEICQKYLKKGSLVYFEGKSESREWEDKDGVKRYTTEIIAREMKMLDSKSTGEQKQEPEAVANQVEDVDDDLPFLWLLIPFGYTLMQFLPF